MCVFVSNPKETNKCIPLPDGASESHDPDDLAVRDCGPACRNKLRNTDRCSVYQNSGKQLHYHRLVFLARKADPLLLDAFAAVRMDEGMTCSRRHHAE